ncbi:MAG: DNA repair protein RecO [Chloroflexi bacterium]|nr:DNA repair protein RecO [Chloroflexota bacterium]
MTKPRTYKTKAIILKQVPLGEADKILTLYTPYMGKLRAVAKGVRKPRSKLSGHVEPLTHAALMLAQGRNLDIVTQSQTIDSFIYLRQDLHLTSSAIYLAELTDCFTVENEEDPTLFQLLLHSLHRLSEGMCSETILRLYEIRLLENLGYRPEIRKCVYCGTLTPSPCYFSPSGGGLLCLKCRHKESLAHPISPDALKIMQILQETNPYTHEELQFPKGVARELEHILRSYISYLLERQLKSTSFLDILKQSEVDRVVQKL